MMLISLEGCLPMGMDGNNDQSFTTKDKKNRKSGFKLPWQCAAEISVFMPPVLLLSALHSSLEPLYSQHSHLYYCLPIMTYKTTGDNSSYLRASTMQQRWSEDSRITRFHPSHGIYHNPRSAVVEAGATALLTVITVSSRIKYTGCTLATTKFCQLW